MSQDHYSVDDYIKDFNKKYYSIERMRQVNHLPGFEHTEGSVLGLIDISGTSHKNISKKSLKFSNSSHVFNGSLK